MPPPLTLENAGALVPGGVGASALAEERKQMIAAQPQSKVPQVQQVKVLRSFYYKGEPQPKDSKLVLPYVFAIEMRAAHKVEFVTEEAKPVSEPAPEPKSAPSAKVADKKETSK